jgi:hypothetical protein
MGAGLVLGLTPVAGAAAPDGSSGSSGSSGARTASSAQCAQLRKRLAGAPATIRRVDANLEELRARLAEARLPARRAVLEQRIQRLGQLRTALTQRIADARAACATTS